MLALPPGGSGDGDGGAVYGDDMMTFSSLTVGYDLRNGANTMISATVKETFCRIILRSLVSSFMTPSPSLKGTGTKQDESKSLRHTKTERPRSSRKSNQAFSRAVGLWRRQRHTPGKIFRDCSRRRIE